MATTEEPEAAPTAALAKRRPRWQRVLGWTLLVVVTLLAALTVTVYALTYHPDDVQPEPVTCRADAPALAPGQTVKVMSWNVQYMAGKGYVFWYDLLDGSGPDDRPSSEAIATTLGEVARVIAAEDPDVVMLQEMDEGAARTDGMDQLAALLDRLPAERWPCTTSAWYWKAGFVPHPRVWGRVGMKLVTLSRYRIDRAVRHQLALMPGDPLSQQFGIKRAMLEASLPVQGGGRFVAVNTHLDAFAQGTDTMERQVGQVRALMDALTADRASWVLGGDFNLLPTSGQYEALPEAQRAYFEPDTELARLYDGYRAVPSAAEADAGAQWLTHYPNDPRVKGPDRTLDYVFLSGDLTLGAHAVLRDGTLAISDHLPVVLQVTLPREGGSGER